MKKVGEAVSTLASLSIFTAGLACLGAWVLGRLLPWTGSYGRAALWGLAELGFVGLSFLLSIRNVVGLAVFLGTLGLGCLWGPFCLWMFRLAGVAPGPYVFTMTCAVSVLLVALGLMGAYGATRPAKPSP